MKKEAVRVRFTRKGDRSAARRVRSAAKGSSRTILLAAAALPLFLTIGLEVLRPRRPVWDARHPDLAARAFLVPQPDAFYRVSWGGLALPARLPSNITVQAVLTLRNGGGFTWPDAQMADPVKRAGAGAVRIGYRWWDADGDRPISDYEERTNLPWPLRPGEAVTVPIGIRLPRSAGTYRLQLDLVQELVTWFEDRGARRLLVPVLIESRG